MGDGKLPCECGNLGLKSGPGEHRFSAHLGVEQAAEQWQVSASLPGGVSLALCGGDRLVGYWRIGTSTTEMQIPVDLEKVWP